MKKFPNPEDDGFEAEGNKIPEYNFAQLRLLVHALEQLDTSFYEEPYKETHRYLVERFRKELKDI
jgi:hypothetical protein